MRTKVRRLAMFGCALLACGLVLTRGQDVPRDKKEVVSKKTQTGFEVFFIDAKVSRDRDSVNDVALYRVGSCPPGAVMGDMKVMANHGSDVMIITLGIKVLPIYAGTDLSLPVLFDADGKKYTAGRNTMLAGNLTTFLQNLKGKDEQLRCEFPFEMPKGTRINKLLFESITFDIKVAGN